MRSSILAIAALGMLAFATPAFAQGNPENENVSDAVDIAMWCGAAFTVASLSEDLPADQKAASDQMATLAFARAKTALDEDGIEEGEYDRLFDFYVSSAVAALETGKEDVRYTADECVEEASAQ